MKNKNIYEIYYAHTNSVDFLAVLNPENKTEAMIFDDYDFNVRTGKSFSDLTKREMFEFMDTCEFDNSRIENVIKFNIDECFGSTSSESYYSTTDLLDGQLDFYFKEDKVLIDVDILRKDLVLAKWGEREIETIIESMYDNENIKPV